MSEPGQSQPQSDDQTHFGFKTVEKQQKASMVAEVFHSVAGKYDLMNDLMSMGILMETLHYRLQRCTPWPQSAGSGRRNR